MMNKHAVRYLRQVRKYLPCGGKEKKIILDQVQNNLNQFVGLDPTADYGSIVRRFGQPQQIAATYVDEMDTAALLNQLRIRRRILGTISFAVAVAIVIWLVTAGLVYMEGAKHVTGIIESSIVDFGDTAITEGQ